jgi:hypothetical protein
MAVIGHPGCDADTMRRCEKGAQNNYAHQDLFYVEVQLYPSSGPAPDYTPGNADLKNEALRFAQAIASSI